MKKIIHRNLNTIGSLQTELQQYRDELDQRLKEALEEMATKSADKLSQQYGGTEIAGRLGDINVSHTINGNSATISASGENIAFVEFGTGIRYPEHPLQDEVEGIDKHGQYGQRKGANPNGWYYSDPNGVQTIYNTPIHNKDGSVKGFYTLGNPAHQQVYSISKWLRQNYIDIIKDKLK